MTIQVEVLTGDSDLRELCSSYWEQDESGQFELKVSELAEIFEVPAQRIPQLVAENCRVTRTDDVCATCGEGRVVRSRSALQHALPRGFAWTCSSCRSEERERAQAEERERAERAQIEIREYWAPSPDEPILAATDLSLQSAVSVLALARVGATEDLAWVYPRTGWTEPFSPRGDFDIELLRELFEARVVTIDAQRSPIDAFEWEQDAPRAFFLGDVAWRLRGAPETRPLARLVSELEGILRKGSWPDPWRGEVDALWRRVALEEAIAYLNACMDDHSLSLKVGDKTRLVLSEALEAFSLGQVYNLIWRAAKDAAAYYMRGGVPRAQAANSVVGAIQRSAERAISSEWDVKAFRRDRRVSESPVSGVLFRRVLALAEPLEEPLPVAVSTTSA